MLCLSVACISFAKAAQINLAFLGWHEWVSRSDAHGRWFLWLRDYIVCALLGLLKLQPSIDLFYYILVELILLQYFSQILSCFCCQASIGNQFFSTLLHHPKSRSNLLLFLGNGTASGSDGKSILSSSHPIAMLDGSWLAWCEWFDGDALGAIRPDRERLLRWLRVLRWMLPLPESHPLLV